MRKDQITFTGIIVNGQPQWRNQDFYNFNIKNFEKCRFVMEVNKPWSKRSLSQNRLLWLWLEIISDDTGHTAEELYVIMKGKFAPKKEVKLGDKVYNIPKGTSELSKGEFVSFLFDVETEAGSLGILLPQPQDLILR